MARHKLPPELMSAPRAYTWATLRGRLGESQLRSLIRSDALVIVLPGVYSVAEHARSFVVKAQAAVLWAGHGASLSGPAALFAWGGLDEPPDAIEIRVPRNFHPHPPAWVRVRRPLRQVDAARLGELDVVNPATAVVTAFGSLRSSERADAVFGSIKSGLVTAEELHAEVLASPRVARRAELLAYIRAAARGLESLLEEISARDVLTGVGFETLVIQHTVTYNGVRARFDFYDPFTRTAFEVDGSKWHGSEHARLRDIRRDAHFASAGILTVRFSWADITQRPEHCRAIALETMRRRAAVAA